MLTLIRKPGQSLILCWNGPEDATDAQLAEAMRSLRIKVTCVREGQYGRRIGIDAPREGPGAIGVWREELLEGTP